MHAAVAPPRFSWWDARRCIHIYDRAVLEVTCSHSVLKLRAMLEDFLECPGRREWYFHILFGTVRRFMRNAPPNVCDQQPDDPPFYPGYNRPEHPKIKTQRPVHLLVPPKHLRPASSFCRPASQSHRDVRGALSCTKNAGCHTYGIVIPSTRRSVGLQTSSRGIIVYS